MDTQHQMIPPPLSLYVHIPWCVRKCPYCDFNSHAADGGLDEAAYVEALLADLSVDTANLKDRPLQSIFIGGGTPSLFSPAAIQRLLVGIRERIDCPEDMEVTLEANPGTLEAEYYTGFRAAGVNRLSIGVQSFDAESLRALERIHGPDEAAKAVESAKTAGFKRINLDLMFGLPGQSLEAARRDVELALQLDPGHISYYQLTLEPNTRFHHAPPQLPDDDLIWEIQQRGQAQLAAGGYDQYEISAYARQGETCRHNLNYWSFGDYLGIGAGAHAKVTDKAGGIRRFWKMRSPGDYLQGRAGGLFTQGEKTLVPEERVLEFMMNGMRLCEGIEIAMFEARTGLDLSRMNHALETAESRGLLERGEGRIRPTELGQRFLNDLLLLFT